MKESCTLIFWGRLGLGLGVDADECRGHRTEQTDLPPGQFMQTCMPRETYYYADNTKVTVTLLLPLCGVIVG